VEGDENARRKRPRRGGTSSCVSETAHYRIICFLAQQLAEKYLKAFLGVNGHEPDDNKTHNLTTLLYDCFDIDKSLVELKEECRTLKLYAVAPRYPGFKKNAPEEKLAQAPTSSGCATDSAPCPFGTFAGRLPITAEAISLAKKIESELVSRCPVLAREDTDENGAPGASLM